MVAQLVSIKDKISLALTCRQLHKLVQRQLYASLDLDSEQTVRLFQSIAPQTSLGGTHREHHSTCAPESLSPSPSPSSSSCRRLKLIQKLSLSNDDSLPAGYFAPLIEQLHCLKELSIISPYSYSSDFDDESEDEDTPRYDDEGMPSVDKHGNVLIDWPFEQSKIEGMFRKHSILKPNKEPTVLLALRSCYIKYLELDGESWSLDFYFSPIFFSSTIIELVLDGCYLQNSDLLEYASHTSPDGTRVIPESLRGSTPLQRLTIKAGNINPLSLRRIMMIPKALKVLSLDQAPLSTCFEVPLRNILASSMHEYIQIFSLQQQSLQELDIDGIPEVFDQYSPVPLDLREFRSLHVVCARLYLELAKPVYDGDGKIYGGWRFPNCLRILKYARFELDNTLNSYISMHHRLQEIGDRVKLLKLEECPLLETIIIPVLFFEPKDCHPPAIFKSRWEAKGEYQPLDMRLCRGHLETTRTADDENPSLAPTEPISAYSQLLSPGAWKAIRECIDDMKAVNIEVRFTISVLLREGDAV